MTQKEFFEKVVDIVADITGVEKEKICSSDRHSPTCCAKLLTIVALHEKGFLTSQISQYLHTTATTIRYYICIASARLRQSFAMRKNLQEIRKQLDENYTLCA